MTKYTFIHPTKSGGTALEIYFLKHYSNHITGTGHNNICTNQNNPIIVVRDVKSRFLSMFKYWKYGAIDTRFKRNDAFKKQHESFTILDFIYVLKNNKTKLYVDFTWGQHFDNTSKWIGKTDYKNIIILEYTNDLNDKIQNLINYIGIPNKNIPLLKLNVSCDFSDTDKLLIDNEDVNKFIEEYFKDDIKLLNTIKTNPQLFKMVI
jgi:hypothetical protein